MYKIEIYKGRTPKWYDEEKRSIKCCFCDHEYALELGDSPARHGQYICPECEEKMRKKYEYGWWSFKFLNAPTWNNKPNELYRPGLVDSLYEKYGILNEKFLHELNKELSEPCPICHRYHTSRDRVSKFNICRNCVKTLPGWDEWVESGNRALVIDFCEKHGFYVSGQLNKDHRNCPKCVKELKTVKCEICGKNYITEDRHLDRIKNGEIHNVCIDCQTILPGFDNWENNKNVCWCDNCKQFVMVPHNFSSCPICNQKLLRYEITCKSCGKKDIVNNAAKIYCRECEEELSKSEAVKEFEKLRDNSLSIIKNDIIMLPIRSYVDKERYNINSVRTCKHCGRLYIAHNSRQEYCGDCWHIVECDNCGRQYMVTPSKYFYNINNTNNKDGEWHGTCSRSCQTSKAGKDRWKEKGICNAPGSKTPIYDDITYKNVQYKNHMIEINENNIEQYREKQGVWYRVDEFGNILQVSETMNIFTEWASVKNIIDQILDGTYKYYCSYIQMFRDGIDLSKTKTYIIDICEDRKRRFDIEANFAIENKAKYWKPAPGYQIKMLYGMEENKNNE